MDMLQTQLQSEQKFEKLLSDQKEKDAKIKELEFLLARGRSSTPQPPMLNLN